MRATASGVDTGVDFAATIMPIGEILAATSRASRGDGVEQAAAYTPGGGVHPIMLVDASGGLHDWTHSLPSEWRPDSVGSLELAACVGSEQQTLVETCQYVSRDDPSNTYEIRRYRYEREITLIEAQTGRTLAAVAVLGSSPASCPFMAMWHSGDTGKSQYGAHVPVSAVLDWLRSYVSR